MLVLIRPQPRRVVIACGIGVKHRFCRRHRLILGEGPGLNTQAVMMMLCHIPGSEDGRIRRAALRIHHDPAFGLQPRVARQFQIEIDADPYHHRIKGFTFAITVNDRQAVIVLQLQRAAAGSDLHVLLTVNGL